MPGIEDTEREKLELERERIKVDATLKRRELIIRVRELRINEKKNGLAGRDALSSPIILALVGLLGTGFGAGFQGFWNARLERQKFESEMIKLALQEKTQEEKANFLNFLKSTQIVTLFNLQNIDALANQGKLPNVATVVPERPIIPGRLYLDRVRERKPMAKLISSRFAAAGFGDFQQAAAIASAIYESELDPKAAGSSGSRGLFGLEGPPAAAGDPFDPEFNISSVLRLAVSYPAFGTATSIDTAIEIFVTRVEHPANPTFYIRQTKAIAQAILEEPKEWLSTTP
jgi:hypothetical protein